MAEGAAALPALPAARRAPVARAHAVGRTRRPRQRRRRVRPRGEALARRAHGVEGGRLPGDPRGGRGRGARPERLLMVDYQQRASDDESLPGAERRLRRLRELEAGPPGGGRLGPAPPRSRRAHRATAGRVPPAMEVLLVIVPFVVLGIGVIFVAFSGGPGAAREAYLTGGGRLFTVVVMLAALRRRSGSRFPAAVIATRRRRRAAVGQLRDRRADRTRGGGEGALHPDLRELPQPRRRERPRRDRPGPRRARRARPRARAERDRARRHRDRAGCRPGCSRARTRRTWRSTSPASPANSASTA